jgi:dienelactone hydrolase
MPGGAVHLEAARELLRSAKTAEQLRLAQAVLLPLELGLSMQQTAAAIGRSVGATCTMRTRFMAVREGRKSAPRSKRELRNRASATLQVEARILDEVLADASQGGVLVVPQFKPAIEKRLGKTLALSSLYRMLARHGWRKLAPDTQHPQGDPQAREDWKKNSPTRWVKSAPNSSVQRR